MPWWHTCAIQSKASQYTHFYYSCFKDTTSGPVIVLLYTHNDEGTHHRHGHTSLLQFGNITPSNQQPDIGMLPTHPHMLCWSQVCGWKCEAFQYPDPDCSEYYSRMVGASCFHVCDSDLRSILEQANECSESSPSDGRLCIAYKFWTYIRIMFSPLFILTALFL